MRGPSIPVSDLRSVNRARAQKEERRMNLKFKIAVLISLVGLTSLAVAQEWPNPIQPQELVTHMLARPCRVLDTRIDSCQAFVIWPSERPPCPKGKVKDGETRFMNFQAGPAACRGTIDRPIPLGARGLILTIAAVEPTNNGHLVMYDPYPLTGETGAPLASTLNFTANQNASSLAFVTLGQFQFQSMSIPFSPDAALTVRVAGDGQVHIIMDVVGYLQEATP